MMPVGNGYLLCEWTYSVHGLIWWFLYMAANVPSCWPQKDHVHPSGGSGTGPGGQQAFRTEVCGVTGQQGHAV